VDQALAYAATRRPGILAKVKARAAAALLFPCTHADTPGTWSRYRKASFFSGGAGFVLQGGLTTLIAASRGRNEFAFANGSHPFVAPRRDVAILHASSQPSREFINIVDSDLLQIS
jgi:hypothetical protein